MKKLMLAGILALGMAPVAYAGTPYPIKVECPITGETFTHTATASYSTYGMYLDGMPVGSWTFPMPVPQCPGSRFPVMKEDYSDAEKTALRALVLTPEYAAAQNEASYYLMDFVMARTGEQTPESHVWMLLQATWQVRADVAVYARYAGELAAAMDAANDQLKSDDSENWHFYQLSTANVLRQSGDFDGAASRLAVAEAVPSSQPVVQKWIEMTRAMIAARDNTPEEMPRQD
ncbi:hypothetical protein ACFPIF_02670 [Brevundimonas faecalis]|uniref:hypothetical protein n=1 Tax=Brevundimonas faecalis TaxID=947378 RepID=UPI00361E8A2A